MKVQHSSEPSNIISNLVVSLNGQVHSFSALLLIHLFQETFVFDGPKINIKNFVKL